MRYRRPRICLLLAIAYSIAWPQVGFAAFGSLIPQLKKTVVNFEVKNAKYFGVNKAGRLYGTGFIVDKTRGLVVTNRHVVNAFPAQIKITFYDGASTFGTLIYYDAVHDFSIIGFDPADLETPLFEVTLGSYFKAKIGDPVLLIGNNEGEEYSLKKGEVVALIKNKGNRHSQTFQTSFDRTGGSSGAPVWNEQGEVIGLHFKGSNTSSFELPIDYISPILRNIQIHQRIARGEHGLQLDHMKIADAVTYFHLPHAVVSAVKKQHPEIKYICYVKAIIHGTPSFQQLQPGDIIYALNDQPILGNLLLFDQIADQHAGQHVQLTYYRRGKKLTLRLPILDAEAQKIREFVLFAGGTFHQLTPMLKLYWDIRQEGVYLAQTERGSTLHTIGSFSRRIKDRKAVVISSIDGHRVKTLTDFIAAIKTYKGGEHITITFKDYYSGTPPEMDMLTLNLKMTPTMHYILDSQKHDWVLQD